MRAGSLAALAARTLGAAPVLLPATRSRFEPDGPGGPGAPGGLDAPVLGDAETLVGAPPLVPAAPPERTPATERRAVSEAHRPPESPLPAGPRPGAALSPHLAPYEPPVTVAGPEPRVPPGWPEERLPAPPRRGGRLAAEVAHDVPGAPSTPGLDPAPAAGSPAGPSPAQGSAPPPGSPPPVIVRIGRVEVRAVHPPAAASPAPSPRRPVPTGASLADRLLARDRGLRP